jgi:glycosyltransferase involved in cell wall biosynthesis
VELKSESQNGDSGLSKTNASTKRLIEKVSVHALRLASILMKIACTTIYDAQDPATFQGRIYDCLQLIRRSVDSMFFLGPLSPPRGLARLSRVKEKYYRRIQHKTYFPQRDRRLVRRYGRDLSNLLAKTEADIVFSPMSPWSQPIAYLECDQPIVIWSDATFAGVVDFYEEYRRENLCRESLKDAIENERAAVTRAAILVYWSEWAAKTAIEHYGINSDKIRIVPAGPASNDGLATLEQARSVIAMRPRNHCRLLFVAMDWMRKGGDTVLEVAKRLNAGGLPIELTLVGSLPNIDGSLPNCVQAVGHIDRRKSAVEANKLNELYRRSHLLFVPSRAEAFGHVFCEASSFAVPSLATDVGGIPSAVRSGVNGQTFSLNADPDEYCKYINNLFTNYGHYQDLALSSFLEFKQRLNNNVAADSLVKIMAGLL